MICDSSPTHATPTPFNELMAHQVLEEVIEWVTGAPGIKDQNLLKEKLQLISSYKYWYINQRNGYDCGVYACLVSVSFMLFIVYSDVSFTSLLFVRTFTFRLAVMMIPCFS